MDKFDATVTNIFNYAIEVFGDAASARKWMHTPLIALGGKTPLLPRQVLVRSQIFLDESSMAPSRDRHYANAETHGA
jgi:hypothetical protein